MSRRKRHDASAGAVPDRRALVIGAAENAGLIEAAKERSGLSSDSELLEYTLARVALEDRFAETLISLRGTVPPDLDLEFRS
jgi:hypothetical protein